MKINKTYLLFLLLGILFLSLSMRRKCEGFTGMDELLRSLNALGIQNLDMSGIRTRTSARTPAPTPAPTPPPETESSDLLALGEKLKNLQRRARKIPGVNADGFLTFEAQDEVSIRTPALLRRVNIYDKIKKMRG